LCDLQNLGKCAARLANRIQREIDCGARKSRWPA
jgi:hypothetical protein